MAQTVGDFLLQRLSQWGVKRIYGYPGDGINGIMGALGRNKEMEFIQARHEELAAFMACLDEFHLLVAAERAHDAVDAIARITVDALNAPLLEPLQEKIADRLGHRSLR